MLRIIFQAESSARNSTDGEERFSAKMELSRRNFKALVFFVRGAFYGGVSCEGREFFIKVRKIYRHYFGKISEIRQKKVFSTESKEQH